MRMRVFVSLVLLFAGSVQASEMCDAQGTFAEEVVKMRRAGVTEAEVATRIHEFTDKRPNGAIVTIYFE